MIHCVIIRANFGRAAVALRFAAAAASAAMYEHTQRAWNASKVAFFERTSFPDFFGPPNEFDF